MSSLKEKIVKVYAKYTVWKTQKWSKNPVKTQDKVFKKLIGRKIDFCQDNYYTSKKGVLRGLHYQLPPFSQSKLVSVLRGTVLDIVVDIRKGSPTFGRHLSKVLSAENQ